MSAYLNSGQAGHCTGSDVTRDGRDTQQTETPRPAVSGGAGAPAGDGMPGSMPGAQRCPSTTGGGRYRCAFDVGHQGLHRAAGVHNVWSDPEAEPAPQGFVPVSECPHARCQTPTLCRHGACAVPYLNTRDGLTTRAAPATPADLAWFDRLMPHFREVHRGLGQEWVGEISPSTWGKIRKVIDQLQAAAKRRTDKVEHDAPSCSQCNGAQAVPADGQPHGDFVVWVPCPSCAPGAGGAL